MGWFLRMKVVFRIVPAVLLAVGNRAGGQEATCRLAITSEARAWVGDPVVLEFLVSNSHRLTGLQANLRADPGLSLARDGIEVLAATEFMQLELGQDCVALGIVFDIEGAGSVPAGESQAIARLTVRVLPGAAEGDELCVEFADLCGDPPKENLLVMEEAGPPVSVYKCYPQAGDVTGGCVGMAPPMTNMFKRGDVNADGSLNIADAIALLSHLFAGAQAPPCMSAADANDDGQINIADAIATLSHLFGGAGDLPAPFAACGVDPTPDDLECLSFPPCE